MAHPINLNREKAKSFIEQLEPMSPAERLLVLRSFYHLSAEDKSQREQDAEYIANNPNTDKSIQLLATHFEKITSSDQNLKQFVLSLKELDITERINRLNAFVNKPTSNYPPELTPIENLEQDDVSQKTIEFIATHLWSNKSEKHDAAMQILKLLLENYSDVLKEESRHLQ